MRLFTYAMIGAFTCGLVMTIVGSTDAMLRS
ncbi:hypothetical protein AIGOOFII_3125 [Methylobacterium marchantiae]|nr:hypothetical protein AIGOOFII_3125 [Methylobacterium marchantiae]